MEPYACSQYRTAHGPMHFLRTSGVCAFRTVSSSVWVSMKVDVSNSCPSRTKMLASAIDGRNSANTFWPGSARYISLGSGLANAVCRYICKRRNVICGHCTSTV
eukprot:3777998-Rhodomonas_salina.2